MGTESSFNDVTLLKNQRLTIVGFVTLYGSGVNVIQ